MNDGPPPVTALPAPPLAAEGDPIWECPDCKVGSPPPRMYSSVRCGPILKACAAHQGLVDDFYANHYPGVDAETLAQAASTWAAMAVELDSDPRGEDT